MKKVVLTVLVLASAILGVGLLGLAEAKPGEGLRFVYVDHGDPADPFHAKIVKGWTEAASALGVQATENFCYGDVAKTIDYVNAAIEAGVDGIFVFSVDPEGLHPSVERAIEKGIDVVLMSSRDPVYGPTEVPFIGFDLKEQGYTLGKYIAEQLKAAGLVSNVHIAFFTEFIAPYSTLRRQGVLQALEDAGITYIAPDTFEVGEDVAGIMDTIKTYLLAHPETNVIVGLGSLTTPGGVMALQALGYEPGKVLWFGFDLNPETIAGIRAGYGASNLDEVFNYGFYACMALYLRAKYDMVVGDLPIATVMVDRSNIEQYEYWVEQGIK